MPGIARYVMGYHVKGDGMNTRIMVVVGIVWCVLAGCEGETSLKIKQDGQFVAVSIPEGATAAEMIQMRGIADNYLVIKAERERMQYEYQRAKLRKEERQFYALVVCLSLVLLNSVLVCIILLVRRG